MVRIFALGQCAIEVDGARLSSESEVVFGLLLYLSARAGDSVSREDIQALFWPELAHARGRHCLRQAAYRLRQLGVPLRSDNESLGVALSDVETDYAALVAEDVPTTRFSDSPIGQILPGYSPVFSTPFAGWVEEYRAGIGNEIRKRLVRAIMDLRSKGRYREAEPLARVCLTSDPFNEVATLTLAESTAVLSGNRAEALEILDRYMDEVGTSADQRLSLSASVLRKRISERFVEQRYGAPPEPPFVGREDVLQLLVEKMQEAVVGRSSVVYLWGEPGIGKTRLLEECAKIAHVQGVRMEHYSVTPNDHDRPLVLFSSLLPSLMKRKGAVGISPEAFEAIRRFTDPSAWAQVEPPANEGEAALTFGRLKNGICELFEALAEEKPLMLCIDDLHWLDARSLEVLSDLVERVRSRPVLFAISSRTIEGTGGNTTALRARAAVRQLEGLRGDQVESLLRGIAVQRSFSLTTDFVRRTVDTSAGNPLFVSELAAHYGWNGVRNDLPHNLQTLLQKRLDAIEPDALLVFQACAVLGEDATVERIRSLLDSPTHVFLRALTQLERAALISATTDGLTCRHELLRREAITRLAPVTRQALYQKVATLLEQAAFAEMNPSLCWHAVQSWINAKQPSRALRIVSAMCGRLLSTGLAKDADQLLESARTIIADSPAVTILLPLQWKAARALGDLRRCRDLALECQALNRSVAERAKAADFAEFVAFDASRALEVQYPDLVINLKRLESAEEDPNVLVELAIRLIIAADDLLDPSIAKRTFAALEAQGTLSRASRNSRRIFELVFHSHYGRMDIALSRAKEIVRRSRTSNDADPVAIVRCLRWAHRPYFLSGDVDSALSALGYSSCAARRRGLVFDEAIASCYRIEVLTAVDRLDEAELEVDAGREIHDSTARLVRDSANTVKAYLMFARGRASDMRDAVNAIEDYSHPNALRRGLLVVDSLRVLEAVLTGSPPDSARVIRLTTTWNGFRAMGSADMPFLALLAGLVLENASDDARTLCRDYIRFRRERYVFPNSIGRRFLWAMSQNGLSAPPEFEHLLAQSVIPVAQPLDHTHRPTSGR